MNQDRGKNTNQIHENVYCNSESYNNVYDNYKLLTDIQQIISFVETQYVNPNMQFYSKMLQININGINPIPQQYTVNGEIDRRLLQIFVTAKHYTNNDYIFFSVACRYLFNYRSNNTYTHSSPPIFINNKCLFVNRIANNIYTFKTEDVNVFHFTFHTPSNKTPKEKSKGAFHLKIDSLRHGSIIPYRPFIVDPRRFVVPKRFITWNMFDASMNNFFTPSTGVYGINDIKSFLLRFPKPLSFPNTPTQNVHYIHDIIQPLYDKIVVDILNPIPTIPTTITRVPPAIEYIRNIPMLDCSSMLLFGVNNNPTNTPSNPQTGQRILYGGRRKTKKRRHV